MPINLKVRNDGWSAPIKPRPVDLILRSTSTGAVHRYKVPTDPRRWTANSTTTVTGPVTIGLLSPGGYDLLLHLPDRPGIAYRPE
jgi:hypothetical protein